MSYQILILSLEVAEDAPGALLLLPLPGPQEAHGALLRLLLRQGRREVRYECTSLSNISLLNYCSWIEQTV